MTRYGPVPGTGRCRLCNQPDGPDHVAHPIGDVVVWLWNARLSWRILFSALAGVATVALAVVFAAVRTALGI